MVECAVTMSGCTLEAVTSGAPAQLPGRARLVRAVALARPRSETWWETMLRLVHELSGIQMDVQAVINAGSGVFIGRADLRIKDTLRLVEHDGDSHRTAQRHRRDLGREKSLAREGLQRYGYTSDEIMCRSARIVQDAEDALGLSPDPRRPRAWWREARLSSVTASGRHRLAERLNRYVRASQRRPRIP